MDTQFKVVWAVSPLEGSARRHTKSLESIFHTFRSLQPTIQPVTLIPAGLMNPEESQTTWQEITSNLYHQLDQLFSADTTPGLQPARLLRVEGHSNQDSVQALIEFGIQNDADLIVVDSHARKGLQRVLLGSFAEALVMESPIPVLVINPKAQGPSQLKRILFPTDFSEGSHEVFLRVAKLAGALKVPVYLFHKLYFVRPDVGMPFVLPSVAKDSLLELKKEFFLKGQVWADHAKGYGARTKLHLDTRQGPAVDEILRVLHKMKDTTLVAMASQSGEMKNLFLGSLTRQILRESPCPVMVLHTDHESKLRHFVEEVAYTYSVNPLVR